MIIHCYCVIQNNNKINILNLFMKKLLSLALFSNTLKTIKMDILNGNKDDFHCYHVNKGEYLDRFIN